MEYDIYKSERFVVTGNMGWRIVITDKHEDNSYELQHSKLARFRRHWANIAYNNKELFIIATIASKTGKKVGKLY